jgi:hypothetical protein
MRRTATTWAYVPRAAVLAGMLALMTELAPGADDITTFTRVRFPQDVTLPLEVSVGAVVVDFARINAREESFDMQGYLNLSWRVPSLAGKGNRRMFREELWAPNIDFVNALEPVKVQNEVSFHVSDDGRVEERVRFSGKFASPLDLRRFPIDAQHLEIHIEPFERNVGEVIFRVDEGRVGRYDGAYLSDWEIGEVHARTSTSRYTPLGQIRARFTLSIDIRRRSTFFLWRVLLPLILLVAASWGIFWVDPTQLQPQISTAVAVLLSIVIFNITIDFALPKVAYLTFIDSHALMSYFFMLMSIGAVFLIHHRLNTRGPDAAGAVQRRARAAFPTAYLVVLLMEVSYFLLAPGPSAPSAPPSPPGASSSAAAGLPR